MSELKEKLESLLGAERVFLNEPMAAHTTFRVGGPADYYVIPTEIVQIQAIQELCRKAKLPFCVIGNGSNLLVSDEGYRGVVIALGSAFGRIEREENCLKVQAGALLSKIAREAANAELSGLEFAAGIPGNLGGAVIMNAGAYGGEMRQVVDWVTLLTCDGEIVTLSGAEMEFGYRTSRAMKDGSIVLEAGLTLSPGKSEEILALMQDYNTRRREKQPLEYPSAGSTFKRPEGYFAGKLIQDAGLAGYRVGGAQVSEKHCGFVINKEHATATDIYTLCKEVEAQIFEKFNVHLEMEVKLLGEF